MAVISGSVFLEESVYTMLLAGAGGPGNHRTGAPCLLLARGPLSAIICSKGKEK